MQIKQKKARLALVTGASAGIGEATAHLLAENGYDLIITGRRREKLERLSTELIDNFEIKCQILCFDIRNRKEVQSAFQSLPDALKNIDILINNAGLASGFDLFQDGNMEDWETMIDTNIKGLLYITKEVVPYMIERNQGQIINIGSIAGKEVYEKGNIYCSTKFAVDALTKGMRIDLLKHNIRVSSVCPGAVETEFSIVRFKGDREKAKNVYEGYESLVAKDIAEAIYFAVSRPPHVNINDMLIMSTAQANANHLNKKA